MTLQRWKRVIAFIVTSHDVTSMIVSIKKRLRKKKTLNQTNTIQSCTHTNVVMENEKLELFLACLFVVQDFKSSCSIQM
jgi:hypothetical protein